MDELKNEAPLNYNDVSRTSFSYTGFVWQHNIYTYKPVFNVLSHNQILIGPRGKSANTNKQNTLDHFNATCTYVQVKVVSIKY